MGKESIVKKLDEYIDVLDTYYNSYGRYDIDETGKGMVHISMTDECDDMELSVDRFLDYMSDMRSLRKVDDSTVRTKHIRQTIIDTTRHGSSYIEKTLSRYVYEGPDYQVKVVQQPFLVGLQNAKDLNCDDNILICPCTGYLALELKYTAANRLSKVEEDNLIRRILFDLTKKSGVAVFESVILDINELSDEADLDYSSSTAQMTEVNVDTATLSTSYGMMDLYRQAKEIFDPEIAFLHYYKIIEYVSPAVAKKKAIRMINDHLNLPASVARDYQYMDKILDIASQYKDDQKDDYLMNNVIQECLDVMPMIHNLPDVLLSQIKNNLGVIGDIDFVSLSSEKQYSLKKQVGSILYSTRNSIVHAKANYTPNGWECPKEWLKDVNEIMDSYALRLIAWNEAQPEWIKV